MSEWEECPNRECLIPVPGEASANGHAAHYHQRILKSWSGGSFWYDGAAHKSDWRIIAYTVCCNYYDPPDQRKMRTLLRLERHELYYNGRTQETDWLWREHASLFVENLATCEQASLDFRAIVRDAAPEAEDRLRAIKANEQEIRGAAAVHDKELSAVNW